MKVRIQRIDSSLPMPEYQTNGSVAFDLYARIDTVIEPNAIGLIPSNLIVETPPGFAFIVASRSSTPKRKGCIVPHGFGLIDQDYCGPEDEVLIQIQNTSNKPAIFERGERIAQGFFIETPKIELVEDDLSNKESRGGFGSTAQ